MLIPLDYYRILGVPIQAESSQLSQAYQQRLAQVPHPDYSQSALAIRRQLLDEAYRTLNSPSDRQAYDAQFLAQSYAEGPQLKPAPDPQNPKTPNLDIDDRQLTGAIALLQELGEYELAIKLSYPYLSQPDDVESGRFGEPKLALADLLLTVVLSYLELGREQWQNNQSEQAASSLKIAQELLLHHGLFAGLRGEIQGDLYRLRPYRILELMANPDVNGVAHRQGLQLLRSMLKERGGIDGTGDDRSGLGVEEFLRFIQQIRSYLSAQEQLALFEAEARRPSAVATYLAAYALLAQGFSQRQPAFVQRSSLLLRRLGQRQDVFLEQAICALLLGQPDEACQYLDKSQEAEPLDAIRSRSGNSPDLLPGLCTYCEQWLGAEVLPHFRDLNGMEVSLTRYFSDAGVQAYLDSMPDPSETEEETWNTTLPDPDPAQLTAVLGGSGGRSPSSSTSTPPPLLPPPLDAPKPLPNSPFTASPAPEESTAEPTSAQSATSSSSPPPFQPLLLGPLGERPLTTGSPGKLPQVPIPNGSGRAPANPQARPVTNGATPPASPPSSADYSLTPEDAPMGAAVRASAVGFPPGQPSHNPALDRLGRGQHGVPSMGEAAGQEVSAAGTAVAEPGIGANSPNSQGDSAQSYSSEPMATRDRRRSRGTSRGANRNNRSNRNNAQGSLAILFGGGALAVVLGGFLMVQAYGAIARLFQGNSGPNLEPNQPQVYLDRPSTDIPAPEDGSATSAATPGELNPAIAKVTVENWLAAKAKALGKDYDVVALETVLVDPMLKKWRGRVQATQASKEHWVYEHEVAIADVTLDPATPNRATVVAQVQETAQLYQGERLSQSGSYDDSLQVRYTLLLVEGQWLISDGKVL